jgi:hypothetical protein
MEGIKQRRPRSRAIDSAIIAIPSIRIALGEFRRTWAFGPTKRNYHPNDQRSLSGLRFVEGVHFISNVGHSRVIVIKIPMITGAMSCSHDPTT